MPKERSPNRDKAFELYKNSNGNMCLKEIAQLLNISDGTVRGWKNKDKWDEKLSRTFQKDIERSNEVKSRSNKRGAPKGNKNATGNKGGSAPSGNKNNYKLGLYEKIKYKNLSDEEKKFINDFELDEIEELKKTVRECDLYISNYENKKNQIFLNTDKFITSDVTKSVTIVNNQIKEIVATSNEKSIDEVILKYDNEIEKKVKLKIRCLENIAKIINMREKLNIEKNAVENTPLIDSFIESVLEEEE